MAVCIICTLESEFKGISEAVFSKPHLMLTPFHIHSFTMWLGTEQKIWTEGCISQNLRWVGHSRSPTMSQDYSRVKKKMLGIMA